MHLSKIKKISVGLCLALMALPMALFAAGLGQLNVASGIGEPLKADIQLLSVTSSEMASLKARIAPQAAYAAKGLERPSSHNDISIRVAKATGGKKLLKLYSNQPITEPFLDMLVELEWGTGRILREYTVLLDPPGYTGEVSTNEIQTPAIKTANKAPVNAIAPIKSNRPIKNTVQTGTSRPAKADKKALEDDYLTRRGDTLSKIALRMKPKGVSLDQMLVGLYEANPEAFVGKNMNRLRVGKILQPPSEAALNAMSRKEAVKEVKVQTANWNKYRNKLAGIVAASAPEVSEVDNQTASGKIKSSAEDTSIPDSTGPKDVVKLSSAAAKANEADMQAKITALEEEVSAREKGLQEAQERTTALEKQIEDMQKLLTLKNNALSDTQQLPAQETAPETVEVVAAEAEEAKVAEADVGTPAEVEAVSTVVPEEPAKPIAKPKPIEVSVKQPSFIANVLDSLSGVLGGLNTTLLAAGAGLIALLSAAWFYLRNKRRKNLADFEQGIMTSGGLKANTVFGNTSGTSVDTGDTSFLTDFSQSTSGGMIDTNDVDPIAEAEVYMAYGRDAQAEEILKDAITKEPKRYELHLKLLEMYAASKNMSAFETVSGELYTTLGADDPTWAKVAEIGIKLEPNNPLYQAKGGVGVSDDATDDVDNTDQKLDASDFSDSPLAAEADLDFSLNEDAQVDNQPLANENGMPFDVDTQTSKGEDSFNVNEEALDIPNIDQVLETDDGALEFDMGASSDSKKVETESNDSANFASTMPNIDLPAMEDEATNLPSAIAVDSTTMPDTEILSDLSLDFPAVDESSTIEMATDTAPSEGLDLEVDVPAEDTISFDGAETKSNEANVLDISDISLDVNEDLSVTESVDAVIAETEADIESEETSIETETLDIPTEIESEEVETKLELVAAYIDMEDKEGAKELLDEVLKEGGANQRKR
ncbi:MAG: FimV/HubP family polar landmark protein, partial [Methylophilaceae bacterium]